MSRKNTLTDIEGNEVNFIVKKTNPKNISFETSFKGEIANFKIKNIGSLTWEETKPIICMICKLPLKSSQQGSRCPMCQSVFHFEHIYEWLNLKGKCPVCLQLLRSDGLEQITL